MEVKDGVLTVSGSRSKEFKEESNTWRRVERSSGSFRRSIALPHEVDQEKITASHENGVLRIAMPRAPVKETGLKRIEVQRSKPEGPASQ